MDVTAPSETPPPLSLQNVEQKKLDEVFDVGAQNKENGKYSCINNSNKTCVDERWYRKCECSIYSKRESIVLNSHWQSKVKKR